MAKARILVVEDDAVVSLYIDQLLRQLGYTVAGVAFSGAEAIDKACDLQPDLVLLDINLGEGMSGIEAALQIKDPQNIPIVFATAHSDDVTVQRAKIPSLYGYVRKPIGEVDLRVAIETALYKHEIDMERNRSLEIIKAAQSWVQSLSGLIPICFWCHKIRVNQDSWRQLESYILEYTDASLTHGICPECLCHHHLDIAKQRAASMAESERKT